jgi:membrane protease YdiL (CAAX protease family)
VSTEPQTAIEERPPWRPWTAPAALLLALAAGLIAGSIVLVGVAIFTGHTRSTPAGTIVATVFGDICFIGSALFFAQLGARPTLAQFGLRVPPLGRALVWMTAGYVFFLAFSGAWLSLLNVDTKDHSLDDLGQTSAALAAAAVLVTVIAPVAEEFLFRGYIFTALRGWAGVWGAALITGALFGAIHLDPDRQIGFLVPLAVFGFVLCIVRQRTGSLLPCIALHSLNNSLAFGVTEDWPPWAIALLAAGALALLGSVLLPVVRLTGRSARLSPA